MLTFDDEFMTVRLTVTLPKRQVEAVRREVAAGRAASVSQYVSHALGSCLGPADGEDASQLAPVAEVVSEDGGLDASAGP